MPRSMTGFGAAHSADGGCRYTVEMRSVNGRFLKCVARVQDELHGLETDIEQQVSQMIRRGTVTVTVRFFDESAQAATSINVAAMEAYLEQLAPIAAKLGATIDPAALLSLPGLVSPTVSEGHAETAKPAVLKLVREACEALTVMRQHEGAAMAVELNTHLTAIESRLGLIRERAPSIVEEYQQRLRQRMQSLLAEVGAEVRPEDVLREVAVFAERSDITEEVARLAAHLVQFRELLASDNDLVGRTLDFLAQEMLREANTIGSKCLDTTVGRAVVEVKGAVDRLKEQVQNLE
ncbi:MAG: YicC family protein [Planctomycetes bacterium]|nr:YicC family protein [Planctomycetota bacterium]